VLRADGMPEDRYVATIRKVGLDLGITQESALVWGVYAPVARLGPGDLAGDYAGAQGSASVGVGLGGNVLVGGSANSIALQPLSVQGQVGLNRGRAGKPGTPAGTLTVLPRPALRGVETSEARLEGRGEGALSANSEIVIYHRALPLTRGAKSAATSHHETGRGQETRDSQLSAATFFRLAKWSMSGEHPTRRPNQGPSSR
jgi:hypothetical protein